MRLLLIISFLLLFGCVENPPKPTAVPPPPSTPITAPSADTSILNGFNGMIFISKTYTKISNEEPEQFLNDVSKLGISDSTVVISCTSFNMKAYIKGIETESNTENKLYFLDFSSRFLNNKDNYEAVLFYDKKRNSMQFHYGGEAFFFYDVSMQ